MKKPLKNRFPTVLLCVTLILTIVVSGLTYPGFMLPLFGEKGGSEQGSSESGTTESSYENKGSQLQPSAEKQGFIEGNSKAFSIEPVKGVTISADENALDHDREFKFEKAPAEQYDEFRSVLTQQICETATLDHLWELDAGLADDELMPGTFKMSFDLEELGIEPEQYENTYLFRIDDNGKWYQYASSLDGSVLSVDSNQNSAVAMVSVIAIFAPIVTDIGLIKMSEGFFADYPKSNREVEIDGKKRFNVCWEPKETLGTLTGLCRQITARINAVAERNTRKELNQRYGEEKVNKWYDGNEFKPNNEDRSNEYERIKADYIKSILKTDEEYKKMAKQIDEINSGQSKLIDTAELTYIADAVRACELALPFLTKELKVNMPTYMVTIELSVETPASGVTISPCLGHPYCVINTTAPDKLLTITHELFHISERTYVFNSRANFKFDEALAQAVEADAYDYFYSSGEIKKTREDALENLYEYQHFVMELDNYREKTDPTEEYPEGTFTGDSTNSCYPFGGFILHLMENCKVNGEKVDYPYILKQYKSIWANGSMAEILKYIFKLDDEKLTKEYHDFVSDNRSGFYASSLNGDITGTFVAGEKLEDKKKEIRVANKDYITRVRRFAVEKHRNDDEKFALVLLKDKDFDANMPDYFFLPLTPKENMEYVRFKQGIFFEPKEFRGEDENYDWSMIESDGGTGKAGKQSGYTLYPMYAPDKPKSDITNNKFTVTFPSMKDSPSYEIADGFIITLYSQGEEADEIMVKKDEIDAGTNSWSCDLNELIINDLDNVEMTISEWIDSNYDLKGPETSPIRIKGGTSGRWVLVDQKSSAPENDKKVTEKGAPLYDLRYSANGNVFYEFEDWSKIYEDHPDWNVIDVHESRATFTQPKSAVNPGETLRVNIKEELIQGNKPLDIYVDAFYNITDDVIELMKSQKDDHTTDRGDSLDVEELGEVAGYTDCYEVKFPYDGGDTGKLVLYYSYEMCETIYVYRWKS